MEVSCLLQQYTNITTLRKKYVKNKNYLYARITISKLSETSTPSFYSVLGHNTKVITANTEKKHFFVITKE